MVETGFWRDCYVQDQVRAGRCQNENDVVCDAIRQMQKREIEQFERLFGEYPGAPPGEPTNKDHETIHFLTWRRQSQQGAGS